MLYQHYHTPPMHCSVHVTVCTHLLACKVEREINIGASQKERRMLANMCSKTQKHAQVLVSQKKRRSLLVIKCFVHPCTQVQVFTHGRVT